MRIVADRNVQDVANAVVGANEDGYHLTGVNPGRDFEAEYVDIREVKEGEISPDGKGTLKFARGIEIGHIFKLGTRYSESMGATILDQNGRAVPIIMGCYGIGVDRTLASIIEEHHDDKGIIWTMSTAPYQVVIVPVKYDGAMKEAADKLYDELTKEGIEVLLDDRNERPGVKFNDADLIGFPIRIVVGEKNLPNIEIKLRKEADARLVPLADAAKETAAVVRAELAELNK
mgnify:CR=1 FL=1